jgi:pilus assembly protein CpaD
MRLSSAAILLSATLMAGCTGTQNRGLESVHQPVVTRADYALDIGTGPDGLAAGEADRLAAWLGALQTGYGDRLAIDDGDMRDPRVRGDIAAVAASSGLLLAESAPVTPGAVTPGTIRVVLTRTSAVVPGCPDKSRVYQPNFNAHTSSDYGCGVNSNLAAMVAQPEDLVRGRRGSGIVDPMTATKPIAALRETKSAVGQPLEAARTSSVGGNQ